VSNNDNDHATGDSVSTDGFTVKAVCVSNNDNDHATGDNVSTNGFTVKVACVSNNDNDHATADNVSTDGFTVNPQCVCPIMIMTALRVTIYLPMDSESKQCVCVQ